MTGHLVLPAYVCGSGCQNGLKVKHLYDTLSQISSEDTSFLDYFPRFIILFGINDFIVQRLRMAVLVRAL